MPQPPPSLSVILPVLNEAKALPRTLARVQAGLGPGDEVIVADGESADGSVEVATRCGARVVTSSPGRGTQMNAGAAAAHGEILLFLHADTLVPEGFARIIADTLGQWRVVAGAFELRIDAPGRSLRLIERLVDWRTRRRSMPYGDQAIFLTAATFHRHGGYCPVPIMEDYDLMCRLRRHGRIAQAPAAVLTSARRWTRRGIWRTTLKNQACFLAFRLGVSPQRIAAWRQAEPPPHPVPPGHRGLAPPAEQSFE